MIDETEPHNKLMLSLFINLDKSVEEQIHTLSEILLENSHTLIIDKYDHQFSRELACRTEYNCLCTCIDFILKNFYNYDDLYNYVLIYSSHTYQHYHPHYTFNADSVCTLCNNNIQYYKALIALRRLDKTIPDYTTGSWNERKYAIINQWI